MVFSLDDLIAIFPDQLWLDLPKQEQENTWKAVAQQQYSNPAARWNAYLNTLCLNRFLSWWQAEFEDESLKVYSSADQSIWEVMNGTVLILDQIRLVLLPDDKSNLDQFCVPQEWVDIPAWVADYYLAIQLNLEDGWLRVLGYTTRTRICEQARYESSHRTYSLNVADLTSNLNVMWVAQEFCSPQTLEVQALPSLSPSQVDRLLKQLSQTIAYSPRLAVPFPEWAAIIASDQYRHLLYRLRLEHCNQVKLEPSLARTTSNLGLWLQNTFTAGWQSLDALLAVEERALDFNLRSSSNPEIAIKGFKLIDLGMQLDRTSVVLLIGLVQPEQEKVCIRARLCPKAGEKFLPANLDLLLLSESGTVLQEVRSRNHDNYIQLGKFSPAQGTKFSIKVALGAVSVQESFVFESVLDK